MNRGLGAAQGSIVARLDQDDLAEPQRLEKLIREFEKDSNLVLVGSWTKLIDARGIEVGGLRPPVDDEAIQSALVRRPWSNPLVHSSAAYRLAPVLDLGGYPPDIKLANDFGLWLKLMGVGAFRNIPEPLTSFRIHDSQASGGRAFALSAREVLALGERLDVALGMSPAEKASWRSARVEYAIEILGLMLTTRFDAALIQRDAPYFLGVAFSYPRAWACLPRVLRRAVHNRRLAPRASHAPTLNQRSRFGWPRRS